MILIWTPYTLPEWVKVPLDGKSVVCRAYPLSRLGDGPPYEYALDRMDDRRYDWNAEDAA